MTEYPVEMTLAGPTVVGASAEMLADLLREFEHLLREQGAYVDSDLNPGLPRAEVVAHFAAAGLTNVPEEALTWFAWHNGLSAAFYHAQRKPPTPLFEPWALERLLRNRAKFLGDIEAEIDLEWNPAWFHLIGDNDGLIMSTEASPETSPLIRSFSYYEPSTDPGYTHFQVVSLCTPVAWWIEDLQNGTFHWDRAAERWQRNENLIPAYRRRYSMG